MCTSTLDTHSQSTCTPAYSCSCPISQSNQSTRLKLMQCTTGFVNVLTFSLCWKCFREPLIQLIGVILEGCSMGGCPVVLFYTEMCFSYFVWLISTKGGLNISTIITKRAVVSACMNFSKVYLIIWQLNTYLWSNINYESTAVLQTILNTVHTVRVNPDVTLSEVSVMLFLNHTACD